MSIITLGQIISAVVVVILILLQERGSGAGGAFGGGGGAEFYQRRRGIEKIIFMATIVTALIFTALSILSLIL